MSVETLAVIYHDDHYIAVHKPSGLLVHRSPIDRHETRFALQLVRDQIGQRVYPVHRLDKPTSGILLFGLSSESARAMNALFTAQQVEKHYLAVVRGHVPESGVIDHAIKDKVDKMAGSKQKLDKEAKPAVSEYQCLASCELPIEVDYYPQTRYSLVKVIPKTGRRHQIRRHMKHIRHPIIGDAKYGKGVHNRFFRTEYDSHRLLLASTLLRFFHPYSEETISIQCPLADEFRQICIQLGWEDAIKNY